MVRFQHSFALFVATTVASIVAVVPRSLRAQVEEAVGDELADDEVEQLVRAEVQSVDLSSIAVTDILVSLGVVAVGVFIGWLLYHGVQKLAIISKQSRFRFDGLLLRSLAAPSAVCVSLLSVHYSLFRIDEIREAFNQWSGLRDAFVVLTITWIAASLIKNLLNSYLLPYAQNTETDVDERIVRVLDLIAAYLIWIVGILIALRSVGIEITAFLASMGIVGLAVAIAAKTVLSNVLAGVTLTADPNIEVGNRVEVLGFIGDVQRINIHKTVVQTRDNLLVSIPNNVLAEEVVVNWDLPNARTRISIDIGVGYDTDIERAIDIIEEILNEREERFDDERKPEAVLHDFGDNALIVKIFIWLDEPRLPYRVRDVILRTILARFRREGIEIPFPQRVIRHADDDTGDDEAATAQTSVVSEKR